MNLVQKAVMAGGKLAPIVIPTDKGTGLMNPSVMVTEDGGILVNVRHVNYALYHSENEKRFPSPWGPITYLHPENDLRLATENYICRLNPSLEVISHSKVIMQNLHEPKWEFHGLEDCRLVTWKDRIFLVGVRRDTTDNGQGRMEYSEVVLDTDIDTYKEIFRKRIPAPLYDDSYCEKNWMPVEDKPHSFVKWCSPTEVVFADPESDETLVSVYAPNKGFDKDQRGGSQVIRWGNYYIAITHETSLWKNYLDQKEAVYRHRLLVWDKEFTLLGGSNIFSFLGGSIEFCAGMAKFEEDALISFGFQDNAAFILRTPKSVIDELIEEALNAGQ